MIDLSVIVVSWNTRHLLGRCLESVYENVSGLDFEVFVVDNASRDGSPQLVRSSYPQVRLVENQDNLGFARACNQGLCRALGRFLALLNPDTWLESDALGDMVGFLSEQPEIGAVGPRIVDATGAVDPRCVRRYPTLRSELVEKTRLDRHFAANRLFGDYLMTYWDHEDSRDVEALSGACMMVRREVLETVGELDEGFFMYGEDTDWCYRIRQAGWRVHYFSDARVFHLGGQSTTRLREQMGLEAVRSINRLFEKHYGASYAIAHRLLMAAISLAKQLTFVAGFLFGTDREHYRAKLCLHRRILGWAATGNTHFSSAGMSGTGKQRCRAGHGGQS